MMISTKGRYALRVMLDLAIHNTGRYIPLKDIAERQGISVKYLENILSSLSRVEMVDATRGKGGVSLPLWEGLDKVVSEYLDSYSLADLLEKEMANTQART